MSKNQKPLGLDDLKQLLGAVPDSFTPALSPHLHSLPEYSKPHQPVPRPSIGDGHEKFLMENEMAQYSAALAKAERRVDELIAEKVALVAEKDRKITELTEQLASHTREANVKEDLLASLAKQFADVQTQRDRLRSDLAAKELRVQALEKQELNAFQWLEDNEKESNRLDALKASLDPLDHLQKSNRALKWANTRLTNLHAELENERDRLTRSRNAYKVKRDAVVVERDVVQADKDLLLREVSGSKTQLARKTKELKKVQAELDFIHNSASELEIRSFETVAWLVESGIENHGRVFTPNICLEGDGPWNMEELKPLLKKCGFKPIGCGSRGAHKNEIVVVGRDADVDLVEAYINSREGDSVKLFPQELFVAALACGSDPFDLITDGNNDAIEVPEFLDAFGHGHPVIEYLKGLQFPWPTFGYEGGEPSTIPAVDDSPLIQLGYHVGVTKGLPQSQRRKILRDAYHDDDLPRVDLPDAQCDEYMAKWGCASSRMRLRRMTWHIAWLIRKNRSKPNWGQAIDEWHSDLDWLKENIYKRMMRFDWPVIN